MPYGILAADQIQSSVTGVSLGAGNATRFKNRIINGAMVINQRGWSGTVSNGNNQFTLDRWNAIYGNGGWFSVSQNAGSVTPPAGFINYLGVTSTGANTTDIDLIQQAVEGLNIADLGWGAAGAKTVTLSFWARSSLTGTFGGSLANSAQDRSYPFSYSIPVANTWTQISITIAGDTTGTWLTTNGIGIRLNISLGCNSTYSGTAGSWAGADYRSSTGATSVVGTSGATFYITGVQLEVGSSATGFEYVDYGTQLLMCQRYYQIQNTKLYSATDPSPNRIFNGTWVTKRTSPSCTLTGITPTGLFPNVDGYGCYVAGGGYSEISKITSDAEL